MRHVLNVYKTQRPDLFRQSLRVSPLTFNKILAKISDHPVFFNDSNNAQDPVENQLAITLYDIATYRNFEPATVPIGV
jgi:hypothetical protein